jgi:dolichyl-phosphate beta-glucosyltransferase
MVVCPEDDKIFLSVVVPAYNEEARIGETLRSIAAYLRKQRFRSEVIVVDDGSRDRTAKEAERALRGMSDVRIIRCPRNAGKGSAVKEGVLRARGDFVLFSDADLSTPIEEIEKFWPRVEEGYDVVIGSRALPGSDIRVRQSLVRELMGKTFNVFVGRLALKGIPDTQCGFKMFRREAAREIFPLVETKGFSFDVEALCLCERGGRRIAQVPVVWRNSPRSRVKIVASSVGMLVDLWKIRRRHRAAKTKRRAS